MDGPAPFRHWRNGLAAPAGFLFAMLFSPPLLADEIQTGGTGVGLGVLDRLSAAFSDQQPDRRVGVMRPSLGSGGGIEGVAAGRLTVSISARGLKESEKKAGLAEHPLCRTPYVLAVSRSNPFKKSLSIKDLVAMIRETTRWPDGTRVRFIMRPSSDSMTRLLKSIAPAVAAAVDEVVTRRGTAIFPSDQDAADALEKIDGSIGGTALALIRAENRALKPLPLGGVAPDLAALADGRYPYAINLWLVTKQTPGADAAAFLKFVRSDTAAAILRNNGCLPAPR